MSHENFKQSAASDSVTPRGLNLCDIYEVGGNVYNTLKDDFAKHGSEVVKFIGDTPAETKMAAAATAVLLPIVIVAEAPAAIGICGATGLFFAGKVLTDTLLPHIPRFSDNGKP